MRNKLPHMNVGDIFVCEFDTYEHNQYGTILLIIADHQTFIKPNTPICYLAVTNQSISSVEDVLECFSNHTIFFMPVSKRFSNYDYRRLIVDPTAPTNVGLHFLGNCSQFPKPIYESIPDEIQYYGILCIDHVSKDINTGLKILKSHYSQ